MTILSHSRLTQAGCDMVNLGPNNEKFREQAKEILKAKAGWMLALGIAMVILGLLAALMPHLATLAVEVVVAYLLIIGGIFTLIKTFRGSEEGTKLMEVVMGLLYIAVGVLLIMQPVEGIEALTLLLAAYFFVDGILRLVIAFRSSVPGGRFWPAIGGICSVGLGVIIVAGYPFDAAWVLGLLVGINLFFAGLGMASMGIKLKQL